MKLFVAVLGLAAVAAAGVVVDHPIEKPVVQPAEKSAMVVEDPLMKLESDVKMIKFYSNPNEPAETHALEMGGMKKVLNGPVMVAFKDAVEDKMNIFLLPYGLKALNVYNSEEAHPLVQFLNNGRQKSFMYLSAGSHLQLPEMLKKLDQINLPAFNLNTVVRIAEHSLPVPYILVVDTDTLQGNSRVADLKELGVFKMDKGVLEIVRDNYPHEEDLVMESRSFGIVPPVNYEYEMPTFADKDLLREHVRPVLAERGLIRKYKMPVFAEKDLVGEYVKPIYTEWDLDSEYGYVKPIYAKHYPTDEYAKAMMVDKDSVRDYERDVIRKYVKPDLVSEYVKPFYTERDLLHEYL